MVSRFIAGLLGLLLVTGAAVMPSPALAIDWESLVSPGPVVSGHAKIEKDCKGCHAPFARDEQRQLCLDCHDKVAADINGKRGFHWRSEAARTGQCRSCHTDHEGRSADITRLDPQTFNHALADFLLEGGHKGLACVSCHEPRAKHRDAPSDCVACHVEQDIHRKSLGEDCTSCHSVTSWKSDRFDHTKATESRYPLTGAHARVDCALCHAGQRYKDTPTACVACHRIDDVHAGQRGTACQDCHNTVAWKEPTFNHLKETGFALTAGHGGLACQACHAGNDFKKIAGKDCVACHRSDDSHQGRNGPECKNCHATAKWSEVRFDHGKEARFALRGAHADLTCVACHKGAAKDEKLETGCVACHRANDPHQAKLGTDCAACHGEDSWQAGIRFDHDLTPFPLVGMHATTACESCHVDKRFQGTAASCLDCHRADDAHEGKLGEKCADCHTPNDWLMWTFDHNTRTDFRIDGAHSGLDCIACHLRPPGEGRRMARDCGGCHRGDDVHGGQFGADCSRCHNTRTFSGARRMPP